MPQFHLQQFIMSAALMALPLAGAQAVEISQGKVCAAASVTALHGTRMTAPSCVNTGYSPIAPDYGISVAAVYRYRKDQGIYKVAGSGGVSPKDAAAAFREKEARYARGGYDSITSDTFG